MKNDDWEDLDLPLGQMSGMAPRASFVQKLRSEIGKAAQRKMKYRTGMSFGDTVIELRKIVQLLRRTLVPVEVRPAFRRQLQRKLGDDFVQVQVGRSKRWRWLVIGSALGSVLSLLGVVTALLLRRRNGHLGASKKTVGAV